MIYCFLYAGSEFPGLTVPGDGNFEIKTLGRLKFFMLSDSYFFITNVRIPEMKVNKFF